MSKVNNNIFQTAQNKIDIARSTFKRPFQHKTSANLGEIIPFYIEEVLPGDTVKLKTAKLIQTGTLIAPIMDNLYFDTYYFYVPKRILWTHFKQFLGENDTEAWTQSNNYQMPRALFTLSETDAEKLKSGKTLFNYLTGATPFNEVEDITGKSLYIDELPLRAYYMICNEYFRNENTKAPTLFTLGDSQNTNISYLDSPYIANKFKDYFTSALPAPQKGPAVSLPLGSTAPIQANTIMTPLMNPLKIKSSTTNISGNYVQASGQSGNLTYSQSSSTTTDITELNLYADLSNATAATINSLRLAFQLQKMYERDARGGTRFDEHIKAVYGVSANSGKIDIPEYLYGDRMPINIDKVIATTEAANGESSTISQSLGNKGGYSNTAKIDHGFTSSFVEPGFIMGVGVLRQENTYSTAIAKMFFKKDRIDYYEPVFANIGEQPIYVKELSIDLYLYNGVNDETTFGYQEAWSEYRYSPSHISGILNPNATNALSYWTLAEESGYEVINKDFTDCNKNWLDRALAASSQATGAQYIADIFVDSTWTRPMPIASIPGLIDHH